MDCQQCQDRLLDYLDGTLDADAHAAVASELERCPECRALEQRLRNAQALAAALPMVNPPPSLKRNLMEAAQSQLADIRKPQQAVEAPEPERTGLGVTFWALAERLGRLLMGPQAAMATVMVLLVAGTAWMVPSLFPKPESFSPAVEAVQEESPMAEPSTDVAEAPAGRGSNVPAADEFELDKAERRRVSDEPPAERARKPSPLAAAPKRRAPTKAKAKADLSRREQQLPASSQAEASSGSGNGKGLGRLGASRSARESEDDLNDTLSGDLEGAAVSEKKTSSAPAAPTSAQAPERAPTDRSAPAPFPAEEAAPRNASAAMSDGLADYKAGRYADAVASFQLALNRFKNSNDRDRARLYLARSLRRSGNCRAALPHYELLLRAPASEPAVKEEAAACYESLGRQGDAARLREAP